MKAALEGWAQVFNCVRWHYFRDGIRSLCKRYAAPADHVYVNGNHNSPDNCAECRRIRDRAENKASK